MPENMMCPDHKATNEVYREEYDRIFERDMPHTEELIEVLKAFNELMDFHIKRFETLTEETNGKTKRIKKQEKSS